MLTLPCLTHAGVGAFGLFESLFSPNFFAASTQQSPKKVQGRSQRQRPRPTPTAPFELLTRKKDFLDIFEIEILSTQKEAKG
jgi:hypothetical protein